MQKRARQAALFPKQSDGGTKVLFDDSMIPDPIKEQPKAVEKKVLEAKAEKKEAKERKKLEAKAKQKEVKKHEKLEAKVEKQSEAKEVEEKIEKKLAIPKKLISKLATNIPEPKKQVVKKEVKKVAQVAPPVSLPITRQAPPKKRRKRKRSLLSLTKTFLDHQKGNSAMFRRGENRKPALEELKYICYEKRLHDALASSWKFLYGCAKIPGAGETRFTFVVTQNGKAEEVRLVVSSGSKQFDNMVLESVEQANFPPIPKHLGVTRYRPRGGIIVLN